MYVGFRLMEVALNGGLAAHRGKTKRVSWDSANFTPARKTIFGRRIGNHQLRQPDSRGFNVLGTVPRDLKGQTIVFRFATQERPAIGYRSNALKMAAP